jgi:hypothetical protein
MKYEEKKERKGANKKKIGQEPKRSKKNEGRKKRKK